MRPGRGAECDCCRASRGRLLLPAVLASTANGTDRINFTNPRRAGAAEQGLGISPFSPGARVRALRRVDARGTSAPCLAETRIRPLSTRRALQMDRAAEINLLKTLLHYIETKTTAMAEAPWHNEVTAYTCPERHKREEEVLIRTRPLVLGLSCDWPGPGAYRTDDFAGVPILTVRGSDGKLRA